MEKEQAAQRLEDIHGWEAPSLPQAIPHGDMPGDKVQIEQAHIQKANRLFPLLLERLPTVLRANPAGRAVLAVCGGSGVGKSEIASLLAYYFREAGVGSYTLSGDNYPHRIPRMNDAERLRVFRSAGTRGLVTNGLYTPQRAGVLKELQLADSDAAPASAQEHPWLAAYQREGRKGLKGYLGSPAEIDFTQVTEILSGFKNGAGSLWLKRMGREETELFYEQVDFSGTSLLIIEWTHGNSDHFQGVDLPILLNSTPAETLAHRRARGRDGGTDSPFTTMVLELEQALLHSQAAKAAIILAKNGEVLPYPEYLALMEAAL